MPLTHPPELCRWPWDEWQPGRRPPRVPSFRRARRGGGPGCAPLPDEHPQVSDPPVLAWFTLLYHVLPTDAGIRLKARPNKGTKILKCRDLKGT